MAARNLSAKDDGAQKLPNRSRRALVGMLAIVGLVVWVLITALGNLGTSRVDGATNERLVRTAARVGDRVETLLQATSLSIAEISGGNSEATLAARATLLAELRSWGEDQRRAGIAVPSILIVGPAGVVLDDAAAGDAAFAAPRSLGADELVDLSEAGAPGHVGTASGRVFGFAPLQEEGWGLLASEDAGLARRESRFLKDWIYRLGVGVAPVITLFVVGLLYTVTGSLGATASLPRACRPG